jgi:ABC-2 type transport system ATP-binding protein
MTVKTNTGRLEAKGLVKRFAGTQVLHGVSLEVAPGEVVGYLGPNGSGKTVTTRLLTGLIEPSEGTITYDGRSIHADLVEYRRRIGYVPEEPHLYTFLSGREYLQLVGRLRSLDDELLEYKLTSFLTLFGIADAADRPMSDYSKGMKQKVLISAALLHDPDLLIFDEPESGLDVTSIVVLRHLVRLFTERGKAILYSSHVLEAVERICHRVIVIHQGRVVADDSINNLGTLMRTTSLEETLAHLVVKDDPLETARAIVKVATGAGK